MVPRKLLYSVKLSWILLLTIQQTKVEAGPTKRSSRMTREVYPEIEPENDGNQAQVCIVGDVVYGVDEPVPAEQPCLKCRCQPPGVQCETVKCAKKSGCKAIHRPNKCCPDYQCECHHEGKIYANGERLKSPPGGECKVCYCRGGEVQCADVSCYIRTDCEAKTVPGQCCPKYDHCPPKEPLLGRPIITTGSSLPNINREVLELWPLTKLFHNSSEETTSPTMYEVQDVNKIDNTPEKESVTIENTIKITRATQADFTDDNIKQIEQPRITIQEIIPEIKEIPITAPSKQTQPQGQLIIEESKDIIDSNVNDLVVTDAEPDSSEISEVFQQPPPVLRIGDKLLFLKQGELVPEKDASTATSIITIIGAEGLQRGFEESAEFHETPTKIYEENSLFNNSNDLEPKTSESTHILSLVKHKRKPDALPPTTTTTIENSPIDSTTISTFQENSTFANIKTDVNDTEINSTETYEITETIETSTITQVGEATNNTTDSVIETSTKTNDDSVLDENPAYPAIPDVMIPENVDKMSQRFSNETSTKTPELQMKILPEVLEMRSNKTIPPNVTHGEWLKNGDTTETPVTVTDADDSDESETTTEVTTEFEHSMESMEETVEDSGENTTPRGSHASIISNENASVEPYDSSESTDMLKTSTAHPKMDDVELIPVNKTDVETTTNPMLKDVEMINNLTNIDTDIIKAEKLQLPTKSINKRESSLGETDDVFKQLEAELNPKSTERTQTAEEEKEENERIFQELLEETSTPRNIKNGDRNAQTLQRVTDAIARITLKGKRNSGDSGILGVLSNFFGPQYKYNENK